MKVSVLVVLYRCRVGESPTLSWLLEHGGDRGFDVLVWDNSPEALPSGDLERLSRQELSYHHCPRNERLSSVYNQVLERCRESDLLVLFDQDSRVEASYFDALVRSAGEHPDVALFVPQVRSSSTGALVSPGLAGIFNGRKWREMVPGPHKALGVLALGSGMALRPAAILRSGPRFDERLSLYCIDTKFAMEYGRAHGTLVVLDATLSHGDSSEEDEPVAVKLRRFRNYIQGYHYVWSYHNGWGLPTWLYALGLGLRRAIRHRRPEFVMAVLEMTRIPRGTDP